MKNKKLIKANEEMLEELLEKGFKPAWYVVYHLNDGLNSRFQQKRRIDPDEVSNDIRYHKHVLYQWIYQNRRWSKIKGRAKSLWTMEYGQSETHPHINMVIEELPSHLDEKKRLEDFFNLTLALQAKSVLFDSAYVQPVVPTTAMKLLRYICKETNENNASIDYYSTDWLL